MKKPFFFLFLILPFGIMAQVQIKGIVLDSLGEKPIPYATLFFNGTSKGTISNIDGEFSIEHVPIPSLLIISHISYETQTRTIGSPPNNNLVIKLKERTLELSPVEISDKNLREANLLQFKNWFLGSDYFGRNTELKNDSVLYFFRPTEDEFRAVAKAPLLIEMPLLGYDIQMQLEEFVILNTPDSKTICSILGYYYFKPYTTTNRIKLIRYEQNRRKAYYNSVQHFCRSLYSGQLKQNGYLLLENQDTGEDMPRIYERINIDSCLHYTRDDEALIYGLKDCHFLISYHADTNGKPIDLTKQKGFQFVYSHIYLTSDSCIVRSDGTIPDNRRIVFGGPISHKRVGSYLPSDYYPRKKISIGK